jgi:hypothetical protein
MSGHLRFWLVVFVLLAGLSTSPASSNPFAALFNAAPAEATAPSSTEGECLRRPGKSTASGQHWVYRLEGHRKCWFQVAEGIVTVKKPQVRHRAAKHRGASPEENETEGRNKAVVEANAELLRSAPAEPPQPTAPTRRVVDAGPVLTTGIATLLPPAAVGNRADNLLTPGHSTPRQVDVETLLAAAPAASDVVAASASSATAAGFPGAASGDDGRGWTWLGVLLIALGLVSVLGSTQSLGRAVLLHQLSSFALPKVAARQNATSRTG